MKNTNLINKLKTEPKFRKNVIAITASSLVLVICAVSIPVGLHVRNSKVQQDTAENITVPITDVTTSSVGPDEVSATEPTTIAALVNETTTAPVITTQKQNNKTGNSNNGNSSSTSNNKPASGSSNSSSSGSGNKTNNQSKPTTTKAPSTTKKTSEASTNAGTYNWTRAQADAFLAKSRAYGESIGLIWDNSFNLTNASWQTSVCTSKTRDEDVVFANMMSALDNTKGRKGAKYFKIWVEENEPLDGYWEFTILYM